jgi:hypothetical protein
MVTARELMNRAAGAGDLASVAFQGIGGVFLAIATGLITGIITVFDVFIVPARSLAGALGDLVTAIFGAPANIILAGAQSTIESLLGQFNVGPLTFALGIGAVLLGLYLVNRYVALESTGNLIPGLPFDVPTPGVEDPEEEEEDG